jgi:hypothetical protein
MIDGAIIVGNLTGNKFSNSLRGNPGDHGVRGYILGDHRASSDNSSFAYMDAVGDDSSRAQPDIIFNHDALSRDPLLDKRPRRILENVINGDDLREWRSVYAVADGHTSLPANDAILTDETVTADADEGMGQITEIVNM